MIVTPPPLVYSDCRDEELRQAIFKIGCLMLDGKNRDLLMIRVDILVFPFVHVDFDDISYGIDSYFYFYRPQTKFGAR